MARGAAAGPAPFRVLRCGEGIEAVEADTACVFGRHMHAEFGIGLVVRGAQKSASGRGPVEAMAGDVIAVNPGEVHDGVPIGDGGRAWRMLYLAPSLVAGLAAELVDGCGMQGAEFTRPVLHDPCTALRFRRLYRTATGGGGAGSLQVDEALLSLLGGLFRPRMPAPCPVPAGIAFARAWMDDDPAAALTLAALAHEAGLGRYQFLRGFARATGLTPHAYLMQRRIQRARQLIGRGVRPVDAAADSGFADQSHMTRLFVRSFGMSPGAYARALG